MGGPGGGKAPIGVTTFRTETLADMNRGRLRGWVIIAGVLVGFLSILAWPSLLPFALLLGIAAVLLVLGVWIHLTLPDAETER